MAWMSLVFRVAGVDLDDPAADVSRFRIPADVIADLVAGAHALPRSTLLARRQTLSTVKPYSRNSTSRRARTRRSDPRRAHRPRRRRSGASPAPRPLRPPAARSPTAAAPRRVRSAAAPRTAPSTASTRSAPRCPPPRRRSAAATIRPTSEPLAIRISVGLAVRRHRTARRRRAASRRRRRSACDRASARPAGVSTSATGPIARLDARPARRPRVSLASQGRITSRFGIARSAASCSTGWCVGPSSPSADAVVREDVHDVQAHRAPPAGSAGACSRRRPGTSRRYGMKPPCAARPLTIAPIACSRTPKCMLRPA